jgi:uncharacterized protein YgiM (DUF1202 family)
MKKNLWIVFAVALSTSLLAQDATNSAPVLQAPPPEPTPATSAPSAEPAMPAMEAPTNAPAAPKKAKTATKKKTAKKPTTTAAHKAKAPELKTVPLVPGPAVVSANHVNVRTKAGLVGEVLTHMTNGESVIVIEEVHLKKSGPDEPSAWAKVLLPPEAHVWVKSSLLDSNNAVASKKVNLRGGPGEAYGVVGMLEKGSAVTTIDTKGEWTQIQAPTNAYAFMAAQYLKQGGEEMAAASTPATTPEAAPATTAMPDMPTVAPATGETPTTAAAATTDTNTAPVVAEAPAPAPAVQEPPPERIVEHEGIVRGSFSIQAPTRYQLVSPDTHVPINYLYAPTTNLDLSRYKGMHIIVTGEEGLDARWKNTPVITIQKIQVLD